MNRIFEISQRLTAAVNTAFHRCLYGIIDWTDPLIMLKGARGVGKTTMLLQRCKECGGTGVYASLDQLWFNEHTVVELADYHYKHGGTHLFLDEMHLYPRPNWEQEIKNIHDSYPGYRIVFTGSSLLHLNSKIADLSRRVAVYDLRGLSLREYLNFTGKGDFAPFSLRQITEEHALLAPKITASLRIIGEFEAYLKRGYYPFFINTSEFTFDQRVHRMLQSVIDIDIPAVANIEYETQLKLKKLVVMFAEQVPFLANMTNLSRNVGVSRNQLIKLFDLLCEGAILRAFRENIVRPGDLSKPVKILFDNPSLLQAVGSDIRIGTVRETFAAAMLSAAGSVTCPKQGDFFVDGKYTFEVGGKHKNFAQIADLPESFVLSDDIETGFGNKIPLWLLGFLY